MTDRPKVTSFGREILRLSSLRFRGQPSMIRKQESIRSDFETLATRSSAEDDLSLLSERLGCLKIRTQEDSIERCYGDKGKFAPPRTSAAAQNRPSVKFGTIQVRQHPIILGDNPAVTDGLPLSIAWDAVSSCTWKLTTYERTHRQQTKAARRRLDDLKINKFERRRILTRLGFKPCDFDPVKKDIAFVQQCREAEKSKGRKKVPIERALPQIAVVAC